MSPWIDHQSEVRLAIVIPVYGHSALVSEALHSALAQDCGSPIHVIAVVDGDNDGQLARTLAAFEQTSGGRLTAVRKRHGGLSSARNSGIDFALRHLPELEAIYFLDADNRLSSNALGAALARMRRTGLDVLYPNIDNFGLRSAQDTGGAFSLSALLRGNYIEAGSLVSARVFKSGLRFSQDLRAGYEDWDFWLSIAEKGFSAAHDQTIGLRYRRRPESMLADTSRQSDQIRRQVAERHGTLFSAQGRTALEGGEEPLFAVVYVGSEHAAFLTDPRRPTLELDHAECARQLHLHRAAETWAYFPPFTAFVTEQTWSMLGDGGLLEGVLWRMGRQAAASGTASLTLSPLADDAAQASNGADLLMVSRTGLFECLEEGADAPRVAACSLNMKCRLPLKTDSHDDVAAAAWRLIAGWASSPLCASASTPWTWRTVVGARRPSSPLDALRFPYTPDGGRHIGLFWSGEPQAAFNRIQTAASALKGAGWRVHLFLDGETVPATDGAFQTITLHSPETRRGRRPDQRYYGRSLEERDPSGRDAQVFEWLDALMDIGSAGALPMFGDLRARKILTIACLTQTSTTGTADGRDGAGFDGLAFEHSVDLFACDAAMAVWLAALGVPARKLIVIDQEARADELVQVLEQLRPKAVTDAAAEV